MLLGWPFPVRFDCRNCWSSCSLPRLVRRRCDRLYCTCLVRLCNCLSLGWWRELLAAPVLRVQFRATVECRSHRLLILPRRVVIPLPTPRTSMLIRPTLVSSFRVCLVPVIPAHLAIPACTPLRLPCRCVTPRLTLVTLARVPVPLIPPPVTLPPTRVTCVRLLPTIRRVAVAWVTMPRALRLILSPTPVRCAAALEHLS